MSQNTPCRKCGSPKRRQAKYKLCYRCRKMQACIVCGKPSRNGKGARCANCRSALSGLNGHARRQGCSNPKSEAPAVTDAHEAALATMEELATLRRPLFALGRSRLPLAVHCWRCRREFYPHGATVPATMHDEGRAVLCPDCLAPEEE